jgi:hypothetical protein
LRNLLLQNSENQPNFNPLNDFHGRRACFGRWKRAGDRVGLSGSSAVLHAMGLIVGDGPATSIRERAGDLGFTMAMSD